MNCHWALASGLKGSLQIGFSHIIWCSEKKGGNVI